MRPEFVGAAGGGDAARRSTSYLCHLPDGGVKEATWEEGRRRRREPVRHQQPAGVRVPPRVRAAVAGRAGAAGQPRRVRARHAARLPQRHRRLHANDVRQGPRHDGRRGGLPCHPHGLRAEVPSSAARGGPARWRTSASSPTSARTSTCALPLPILPSTGGSLPMLSPIQPHDEPKDTTWIHCLVCQSRLY